MIPAVVLRLGLTALLGAAVAGCKPYPSPEPPPPNTPEAPSALLGVAQAEQSLPMSVGVALAGTFEPDPHKDPPCPPDDTDCTEPVEAGASERSHLGIVVIAGAASAASIAVALAVSAR